MWLLCGRDVYFESDDEDLIRQGFCYGFLASENASPAICKPSVKLVGTLTQLLYIHDMQ